MKLPFTKMHGLGNDFVVLDFTKEPFDLSSEQATKIADRNFGIGCDQILIIESSNRDDIDFKYRILNADGSEVGQCGNGSRCFALYVYENKLSDKSPITVETLGGDMILDLDFDTREVTVNMGIPNFEPAIIPLAVDDRQTSYQVEVENQAIEFSACSIGNPHAILQVSDTNVAAVSTLGPSLESHEIFPERANIGFMQIHNRQTISLRVFERGVGETIACGSGACAAVVCGIQNGNLDNSVTAKLKGGDLHITWAGEGQPVIMTGPAENVFHGTIDI